MSSHQDKQIERALEQRRELAHEIEHGPQSRRATYKKLLVAGGALAAISKLTGGNQAFAGTDPSRSSVAPPTTPFLEPLVHVNRPEHIKQPTALAPAPAREPNVAAGEARRSAHQAWGFGVRKTYQITQRMVENYSVHRELPGQSVFSFDGKFPGPTYHGRYGEPVIVRVRNELPQNHVGFGNPETTTHLHNMHNPWESDGNPDDYYPKLHSLDPAKRDAGTWRDYHYPLQYAGGDPNEALGTLWYHDHRHDFTAPNTYRGLAGFFLMFDHLDTGDETTGLRLPSGEYDVPLMLSDRFFDHSGRLYFDQFNLDGMLGNKYLVNGKVQPVMQVEPRKYRLRLLNSGPSRVYGVMLLATADTRAGLPGAKPVPTAFLLGAGGNLLPRPIPFPQAQAMGPADRLDVWVDFSSMAGQQVFLANVFEQDDGRGPNGYRGSGPNGPQYDRVAPIAMMRFDVVLPRRGDAGPLPQALRPLPWDPNDAIGRLTERQILDAVDRPNPFPGVARVREFRADRSNGMWTINGKLYDGEHPSAVVGKGTQEIWIMRNGGNWVHPMHPHLEEFRTLYRDGRKPGPEHVTYGRDDVMTLGPGETGILAMKFRDYTGKYVMHCHNTVHEDHAMMIRFDVQG